MKLSYLDKQFILLTKGHFEKAIVKYSDIKEIVAEVYMLHINQVQDRNVFDYVTSIYDKLITNGYIKTEGKTATRYLINQIYKYNLMRDNDSLLDYMISEISGIISIDLELGEADGSLLPLNKASNKEEKEYEI